MFLGWIFEKASELVFGKKKQVRRSSKGKRSTAKQGGPQRTEEDRETVLVAQHPIPNETASREAPFVGTPPTTGERHGAGRDVVSFEQRRRGGPVTGEAPPKAHGPRHHGGGKKRGRSPAEDEAIDAMGFELPLPDYDTLSTEDILARIDELDRDDIRVLRAYEVKNKHREQVVKLLDDRLAA